MRETRLMQDDAVRVLCGIKVARAREQGVTAQQVNRRSSKDAYYKRPTLRTISPDALGVKRERK